MIKCNVTVCGTVSKEASIRTSREGKSFVTFNMRVKLPEVKGHGNIIDISVTRDDLSEEHLADFAIGVRVSVSGIMIFRKRGNGVYVNLYAENFSMDSVPSEDSIEGKIKFRGKLGKTVNARTDKKNRKYFLFSGVSSEKVENGFEFLWVSFFLFGEKAEPALQPEAKVEITGDLEVSFYNDKLNLCSRVEEIIPYQQTSEQPVLQ